MSEVILVESNTKIGASERSEPKDQKEGEENGKAKSGTHPFITSWKAYAYTSVLVFGTGRYSRFPQSYKIKINIKKAFPKSSFPHCLEPLCHLTIPSALAQISVPVFDRETH